MDGIEKMAKNNNQFDISQIHKYINNKREYNTCRENDKQNGIESLESDTNVNGQYYYFDNYLFVLIMIHKEFIERIN